MESPCECGIEPPGCISHRFSYNQGNMGKLGVLNCCGLYVLNHVVLFNNKVTVNFKPEIALTRLKPETTGYMDTIPTAEWFILLEN